MFQKKTRLALLLLSVMLLGGCGEKESTGNNAGANGAGEAGSVVEAGAVENGEATSDATEEISIAGGEASAEYYTVDKDGVYTFHTELFDPEKFSGIIYIHDQVVSLPLTHENLNAANIYVGEREWFEDGTDYETHLAKTMVEAEDDEKYYDLFYKVEGSAVESVKDYGDMFMYNDSTEELPMSECKVGRYDTSLNGGSSQIEAAWKMFYGEEEGLKRSENKFKVDAVMEILGAPAASHGSFLVYPYEDYVILVSNYYAGNCDLVWIYSWEYFLEEHGLGKSYESDILGKIPEEYRYGHY